MSTAKLRRWIAAGIATVTVVLTSAACAPATDVGSPRAEGTPEPGILSTAGPDPENVVTTPPVDVLVRDEIWLARGGRVSLAFTTPRAVYRVPAGWLVLGNDSSSYPTVDLWLLADDGHRRRLGAVDFRPLVSPDGRRIAYAAGDSVVVARIDAPSIDAAALITVASTPAGRFGPLAFAGDRIVLGYSETGGGLDHYDLWDPARGPFVASAPAQTMDFIGASAGGLVARVMVGPIGTGGKGDLCLGLVAPDGFRTVKTACGLDFFAFYGAPLSPDGRWLIGTRDGTKTDGNRPDVVDLTTVFDHPQVLGDWPDDRNRHIDLASCVWPSADKAVCGAPGRLATLTMTAPGHVEWARLDGVATNPETTYPYDAVPVPVLGVVG